MGDLEVPLHTIPGLASTDQYLEMKKKDKRKDSVQEDEEEEDQVPSMLVSLNAEMPEGVELSDGDDDDDNDQTNDDPHKALGAINLDDLDVPKPSSSSITRDIDSKQDQIVDLFNSSEKNAKTKVKKKKTKEKKEKKSKKSKKSS